MQKEKQEPELRKSATKFVLLVGAMSLFADLTYEGSRSILGPYLGLLGLSGTAISVVSGIGELLGYGLRPVSGRFSDISGKFWPIAIFGYVIQMVAVPLLGLANSWLIASWLLIQERAGKAIRNPPRDVMISHAAKEIGYGWAFGVHEALDQLGALIGPIIISLTFISIGTSLQAYRIVYLYLAVPAAITLIILTFARITYPRPEVFEGHGARVNSANLPSIFWIYLGATVLSAVGIGNFLLLAYHFEVSGIVDANLIPVFYALAMGAGGFGSLILGKIFDKFGLTILPILALLSALSSPLVWMGGFYLSLIGIILWGLGTGVQESIIPAAVATIVPVEKRSSAYGIFTAGYGVSLFAGSAIIGLLYAKSVIWVVLFSISSEMLSIPVFLWIASRFKKKT